MKEQQLITLGDMPIAVLTQTFNDAFTGYYVPINFTEEGMMERIKRARIDLALSVGILNKGTLVAFMLTGIGEQGGLPTAYNAGTGVIKAFRRQGMVRQMYDFAIPLWQQSGCQRASLEVITENERAIKAYQGVGFQIGRKLRAFKKNTDSSATTKPSLLRKVAVPNWERYNSLRAFTSAWDYTRAGVEGLIADYTFYEWGMVNEAPLAYAIVHKVGRVAQAGVHTEGPAWETLLGALENAYAQLTWVNIDDQTTKLLTAMNTLGWEHIIDQYEMERPL
ncbi:MAG: GNAT family N-acetyltransferase [Lewinella sp.]|uniref:GNAT family N-acetyltransferase n=1 Tax=Lewinella sp. TaxID=2004506 RepID=UPI003D6A3213